VLAAELAVSRGVVVDAYQRLIDEGLASARTGAGTTIVAGPPVAAAPSDRRRALDGLRLPLPPADGIDIDLSPGVPDLSAFPRTKWLRAERAVLDEITSADLGYGDPGGTPRLRTELVSWLARTRGVRAEPDDVIVVGGVAQALALLAQTLRADGITAAAVEDPGSRGARDQMAHWGVRPEGVDVDEVRRISEVVRGRFIWSGGIGSLDDLRTLRDLRLLNLAGVISGKALYENRFGVAEGQAELEARPG